MGFTGDTLNVEGWTPHECKIIVHLSNVHGYFSFLGSGFLDITSLFAKKIIWPKTTQVNRMNIALKTLVKI